MHLRTVWAKSEVKPYRLTLSTMSHRTSQLLSKYEIQKKIKIILFLNKNLQIHLQGYLKKNLVKKKKKVGVSHN